MKALVAGLLAAAPQQGRGSGRARPTHKAADHHLHQVNAGGPGALWSTGTVVALVCLATGDYGEGAQTAADPEPDAKQAVKEVIRENDEAFFSNNWKKTCSLYQRFGCGASPGGLLTSFGAGTAGGAAEGAEPFPPARVQRSVLQGSPRGQQRPAAAGRIWCRGADGVIAQGLGGQHRCGK